LGIYMWKSTRKPWRLVTHPAIATHLLALIALGYQFTYVYNMGLAVRQRLMCFPAMLFIYFYPLVAKQAAVVANRRQRITLRPRLAYPPKRALGPRIAAKPLMR
jgi:hypothetical protein